MDDRRDALIRRAAELADCSLRVCSVAAELRADSEELVHRLAETQRAGARTIERLRRLRPASYPGLGYARYRPGAGDGAARIGPQPQARTSGGNLYLAVGGADMLDEDEAVTLAALLEELAARHRLDPLSGPASQAAALLWQRVAARQGRGIRSGPGGPAARREAGDSRDDEADDRDTEAGQRDRHADERDDIARERDLRASDADQKAGASEQRVHGLLWDAALRDKAAAEHAAVPPRGGGDALRQQWQLDREMAETGRVRNREDREAIRELLSEILAGRWEARDGRYADGRDRVASHRDRCAAQTDRRDAARDRQAARADRDQAVIENEEQEAPRD
jgi:hypothetical protein